jgi:lysophospholipase L1-like esterase
VTKKIVGLLLIILLSACSVQTTSLTENVNHSTALTKKQSIPESFFPKHLNIVSMGDSLTQGVGDTTQKGGYTYFLENLLVQQRDIRSVSISNYGIKGHKSDELLKRLEKEEIPTNSISDADYVIITIGANDMMKVVRDNFLNLTFEAFETEQQNYGRNLAGIIEKVQQVNKDCTIVLVGLYNPFFAIGDLSADIDSIVKNWNDTSTQIMSQYKHTLFVKVDDIFINPSERLLYTDEFHPNTRGYELLGERIYETIVGN